MPVLLTLTFGPVRFTPRAFLLSVLSLSIFRLRGGRGGFTGGDLGNASAQLGHQRRGCGKCHKLPSWRQQHLRAGDPLGLKEPLVRVPNHANSIAHIGPSATVETGHALQALAVDHC